MRLHSTPAISRDESGQAVTEYILLLATVVSLFVLVSRALTAMNLSAKLTNPIKTQFAAAYRYGHPKAKGYAEGTPDMHPRVTTPEGVNFRLFINPSVR
jgi:hypothetical protein